MNNVQEYANLIKKAAPDYVEPKAFMYVGFSRRRLTYQNMPQHSEVQRFASYLSTALGFNVLDECVTSRVVLLSRFKAKQLINTP